MQKRLTKFVCILAAICLAAACLPFGAHAEEASATTAETWFRGLVGKGVAPFSATVGSTPFEELLARMDCAVSESTNEKGDLVVTATYTDAATGLEFVTEGTMQPRANAVWFVTRVTNKGGADSEVITDFCGLRNTVKIDTASPLSLETTKGCLICGANDDHDYEIVAKTLAVGGTYTFFPYLGRPSNKAWPYFLLTGDKGGAAVCVGWTGQWEASFSAAPDGVFVDARQQEFAAYLKAGETVRTPSVCVMFFDGGKEDGYNAARRLIRYYFTPENVGENGENYPLPMNCGIGNGSKLMLERLNEHVKAGIPTDALWVDAGWYGEDPNDWSAMVGTWYYNKNIYPGGGMKAFADAIHAKKYKFMLWFEVERARSSSAAARDHRDLFYTVTYGSNLHLRLDTEEGYTWMRDTLVDCIQEWGVDIYRQDYNIDPLRFWQSNDNETTNRVGITENRYVTNLYRLYDELLTTFPNLIIDNCSSGGRRLDIEMMSRSIPMWFTDYSCTDNFTVEGAQRQAACLSNWFPFFSAGFRANWYDPYVHIGAMSVSGSVPSTVSNAAELKRIVKLYKDIRPFFAGDYYMLFEPTFDTFSWQGREFVSEDKSEAIAILINRPDSTVGARKVKFKGLDADATYNVSELAGAGKNKATGVSGKELMENGVTVSVEAQSAVLLKLTKAS